MENNNIIETTEDIFETTGELVTAGSNKTFNKVAGVGLVILIGGITYKFAIKPLVRKIKEKRLSKKLEQADEEYAISDEIEE